MIGRTIKSVRRTIYGFDMTGEGLRFVRGLLTVGKILLDRPTEFTVK